MQHGPQVGFALLLDKRSLTLVGKRDTPHLERHADGEECVRLVGCDHVVGELGGCTLPFAKQALLSPRFKDEVGLECSVALLAQHIPPAGEGRVEMLGVGRGQELCSLGWRVSGDLADRNPPSRSSSRARLECHWLKAPRSRRVASTRPSRRTRSSQAQVLNVLRTRARSRTATTWSARCSRVVVLRMDTLMRDMALLRSWRSRKLSAATVLRLRVVSSRRRS